MEFWQWFKEICYYGLNGVHLIYVGRLEMRGHRPNASSLTDVSVYALMYLLDMYKHNLFLCCWMNETHEPTFLKSHYFSCRMLLFNTRHVIIGEHSIMQRLKKTTFPILKSSFDFCTFCWNMPKGFFLFYYSHFAFIILHKPSDADGKIALVWSGLASGHLTVICWSCAIAWWLSSSKATGL